MKASFQRYASLSCSSDGTRKNFKMAANDCRFPFVFAVFDPYIASEPTLTIRKRRRSRRHRLRPRKVYNICKGVPVSNGVYSADSWRIAAHTTVHFRKTFLSNFSKTAFYFFFKFGPRMRVVEYYIVSKFGRPKTLSLQMAPHLRKTFRVEYLKTERAFSTKFGGLIEGL